MLETEGEDADFGSEGSTMAVCFLRIRFESLEPPPARVLSRLALETSFFASPTTAGGGEADERAILGASRTEAYDSRTDTGMLSGVVVQIHFNDAPEEGGLAGDG
jgi:hypothetical protein